jgi:hypothetical protein
MFLKLFFSILAAQWAGAEANGFMLSNDQPNVFEDPPLIPQIHPIGETTALKEQFMEPEGGRNPFANKDIVEWKPESQLPKPLQWFLGGLWVLMLASLPFIIPICEGKQTTKTQMVIGGSMLTVLFGGFYLFTNVILFQSVHFKDIRPLTIVECIYLMSQLITTVGYGDITPAKIRGQVFVGLYVLGALFIIAMLISDITNHVCHMVNEYKEKRTKANNPNADDRVKTVRLLITPEKPSVWPFVTSMLTFAAIDICWIIFFSTWPGEGKTVFQATYMSVITLSTVGLGWFTPVTEAGMIFGAFWMLFGSVALVSVIGNFTELMIKMKTYESFREEDRMEAMNVLATVNEGSDDVTELEFYKFGLLYSGVSKQNLDHIHEAFELLKGKDGLVSFASIAKSLETVAETPRTARED